MAKIKGNLQFPVNEIKNPVFSAPTAQPTTITTQTGLGPTPSLGIQTPISKPPLDGPISQIGDGIPTRLPPQIKPEPKPLPVSRATDRISTQVGVERDLTRQPRKGVPTEQAKALKPVQTQITPISKEVPSERKPDLVAPVVENVVVENAKTGVDNLERIAIEALTNTEDPISKAKFNQAITNIGLNNQAERELLQQKINNNPDLAGQPAGTALLSMLSREQGFDVSNMIATLSIESANRIRELNQWGFDRYANITNFRETQKNIVRGEMLAAGDFDGYASKFEQDTGISIDVSDLKELSPATANIVAVQSDLLNQALKNGNIEKAREHFETITALSPNAFQGADFDSLGFADQSYLLEAAQSDEVLGQIRLDIATGDITGAIEGIEANFDVTERVEKGQGLFQDKTLEEINSALEAAGFTTITDKSEMIGQEDELFTAFKIQELQSGIDKSSVDVAVDFFTNELNKSNPGLILDPDAKQLIRDFALDMTLGGGFAVDAQGNISFDPNEIIEPWDDESDRLHIFKSWDIMNLDGTITSEGEFYTESNPRPDPDTSLGQYMDSLDKKWENYLLNTPKDGRLSKDEWFFATGAGEGEVDESRIPGGVEKDEGSSAGADLDLASLRADRDVLTFTEFNNKFNVDSKFREDTFKIATDFTTDGGFKNFSDKELTEIIEGPTKGIVLIGGRPHRLKKTEALLNDDSLISFRQLTSDGKEMGAGSIITSGVNKGKMVKEFVGGKLTVWDIEDYIENNESFGELLTFDEQKEKIREERAAENG